MPELFPALDLRKGKAVRLLRGRYEEERVYSDDPVAIARSFLEGGARYLHLVDLEGARSGAFAEEALFQRIVQLPLRVQVGGGIRSPRLGRKLLKEGAYRIVVGTMALEDGEEFRAFVCAHPQRIVLSLDLKGETIQIQGWQKETGIRFSEFLEEIRELPLAALLVTAIERDGTLEGPDFPLYRHLLPLSPYPILASGGVGSLDHLRTFSTLAQEFPGKLLGVIVGRALYEGRFTVQEALNALKGQGNELHGVHP